MRSMIRHLCIALSILAMAGLAMAGCGAEESTSPVADADADSDPKPGLAACSSAPEGPWTCSEWSSGPALATARHLHTVTRLDDGRLFVAGGALTQGQEWTMLATTELFDPATGIWSAGPEMGVARARHQAVLLDDGRVLIAGGGLFDDRIQSAEIFDPATGSIEAAAEMTRPRSGFVMLGTADGAVAIGGATGLSSPESSATISAEHYDAAADAWSTAPQATGGMVVHDAVVLPDGEVVASLVKWADFPADSYAWDAQIRLAVLPLGANTWEVLEPPCGGNYAHGGSTLSPLASGRVLLTTHGGFHGSGCSVEYDPATGAFEGLQENVVSHLEEAESLQLPGGDVLIYDYHGRYYFYDARGGDWSEGARLAEMGAQVVLVNDCVLMAVGGMNEAMETLDTTSVCSR